VQAVASYQQMMESYITEYRPELKTELVNRGELHHYLDEQAEAMRETKAQLLAQLQQHSPGLSPLQADMEAERAMLDIFMAV